MAKYRISQDAKSDLAKIRRYTIDIWGKTQWAVYSVELKRAMLMLSENPQSGICCDEIRSDFYRFPLKNHSIYFKNNHQYITIIRVLKNSMCPSMHLKLGQDT